MQSYWSFALYLVWFNKTASQDKFTLPPSCGLCTCLASFSLLNINTDKLTNRLTLTGVRGVTFPTQPVFISPLTRIRLGHHLVILLFIACNVSFFLSEWPVFMCIHCKSLSYLFLCLGDADLFVEVTRFMVVCFKAVVLLTS